MHRRADQDVPSGVDLARSVERRFLAVDAKGESEYQQARGDEPHAPKGKQTRLD